MKQTIEGIKRLAERTKLITALLALFMSGALIATTISAWYTDRALKDQAKRYDDDIVWLKGQLDYERDVTRKTLGELTGKQEDLTGKVEYVIGRLDPMANTLQSAAQTAKAASTTAERAATTIKEVTSPPEIPVIRETVAPAPKKKPEQRDVPDWLGGG